MSVLNHVTIVGRHKKIIFSKAVDICILETFFGKTMRVLK